VKLTELHVFRPDKGIHDLHLFPVSNQIKGEMAMIRSMHWTYKKYVQIFMLEILKLKFHLGDIIIGGRMTLERL
jgi:hypothetical protein